MREQGPTSDRVSPQIAEKVDRLMKCFPWISMATDHGLQSALMLPLGMASWGCILSKVTSKVLVIWVRHSLRKGSILCYIRLCQSSNFYSIYGNSYFSYAVLSSYLLIYVYFLRQSKDDRIISYEIQTSHY